MKKNAKKIKIENVNVIIWKSNLEGSREPRQLRRPHMKCYVNAL